VQKDVCSKPASQNDFAHHAAQHSGSRSFHGHLRCPTIQRSLRRRCEDSSRPAAVRKQSTPVGQRSVHHSCLPTHIAHRKGLDTASLRCVPDSSSAESFALPPPGPATLGTQARGAKSERLASVKHVRPLILLGRPPDFFASDNARERSPFPESCCRSQSQSDPPSPHSSPDRTPEPSPRAGP